MTPFTYQVQSMEQYDLVVKSEDNINKMIMFANETNEPWNTLAIAAEYRD